MRNPKSLFSYLLFVFALFTAADVCGQSASSGSLSTILNDDGSVKKNVTGSFDPSGFRMSYGPNGEPRFFDDSHPLGGCTPDSWDTTFTANGADNTVEVILPDGAGNLYIAGRFNNVNSVPAVRIAKWNGTSWSALGSGIIGTVNAMAISGTDLYVGGQFTSAGGVPALNIAKWNGSSWSQVGPGIGAAFTRGVNEVVFWGGDLYIGGGFRIASGDPVDGIARWDGTSWNALGSGILGSVGSIAIAGGNLYAGGNVALPSVGISVGILKWDGVSWSSLGTSSNTDVTGIAVSGTDLYVIGSRIVLPGQPDSQVAKLSGTTWTRLANFGTVIVRAVAVVGSDLYVGGSISQFNHLAKWNGTTWNSVGSGLSGNTTSNNEVWSLAASGNTLYVGGAFALGGGVAARNIATLTNGTTWAAPFPGTGLDSSVTSIANSGSDVYVAGNFSSAGTATANRIAKWNGNTWSALGSGLSTDNISIRAVAVSGGYVYAAGQFTNIDGVSANAIARWNGNSWSALGTGVTGMNGTINVITAIGGDIYVGGSFSTAGGVAANRIAKWNGTTWSSLPGSSIITSDVVAIAPSGNDLYVGATTTTADSPNYFLKFDGTNWTGLSVGFGGHGVTSLAVLGTDVYVTGAFPSIGGLTVNRIAKWNGSSWSALGAGLPGNSSSVRAVVLGNDVIAFGDFTTATGSPTNRIARWNGSAWSSLGNGLNGGIPLAATVGGGSLYVGGAFSTAGCNISAYFARWRETVWTGTTNTDWHTVTNWGSGAVPPTNAGVTIASADASISSADVIVSSLIVTGGRTLTIGAGRRLTVTGYLDISNGSVSGPGELVANDVILNGGDITNAFFISIDGSLSLNGGKITGAGPVFVTSCNPTAVIGGSNTSFVSSPLRRCVNSSGTFRFPVGTDSTYAPVELRNIFGTANFTVEPKAGPYSDPAAGLPNNRLLRWWKITHAGIGNQVDITFSYADSDVVQTEGRYRVYRINNGSATQLPSSIDTLLNRATATAVEEFSSFTLAEGTPAPRTLSGRLTNPNGRGASGVLVALTDDQNNVRYAVTNPFGYYRFMDVLTFRTYTVQVRSKKFTFAVPSRVVEFDEYTASVNFVSSDN